MSLTMAASVRIIVLSLLLVLLELPTGYTQDDDGACKVIVILPFTSRYA